MSSTAASVFSEQFIDIKAIYLARKNYNRARWPMKTETKQGV